MWRLGFGGVVAAGVLASGAAAQTVGGPPPKMTQAEGLQLFAAAGFKMGNGAALNVCGKPATPKFGFIDLNGDGQPESVAIDNNAACYGPPGDWFAVLAKGPDGQWRALLREVGTIALGQTRTNGWLDAKIVTDCPRIWRYSGTTYVPGKTCVAASGAPAAKAPPPAPTAPVPPAARTAGFTAADRAAAFRAAGLTQKGGRWVGCDGETEGSIEASDIRDINGDGQVDVLVTESGTACFGNTGQGFHLIARASGGGWKELYSSPGIPEFQKTAANGWPDVEVGGPGFCFPILRWTGKTYAFLRNHEYEKGACARR
jgi:hypothetical protein